MGSSMTSGHDGVQEPNQRSTGMVDSLSLLHVLILHDYFASMIRDARFKAATIARGSNWVNLESSDFLFQFRLPITDEISCLRP